MFKRMLFLCFCSILCHMASGQTIDEMRADAEKGDLESQNNLGYSYQKGEGVEIDLVEGFKWFKKAAERGYAKSQSD